MIYLFLAVAISLQNSVGEPTPIKTPIREGYLSGKFSEIIGAIRWLVKKSSNVRLPPILSHVYRGDQSESFNRCSIRRRFEESLHAASDLLLFNLIYRVDFNFVIFLDGNSRD